MMEANIQYVFDEQKANFDHFNELNFNHRTQHFKYLPGQKTGGCVNSNKYGI